MNTIFLLSVATLTMFILIAFVIAFRNCRWTLIISIPLILFLGALSLYSYQSMLGYPIDKEWKDLPSKLTIVFFESRKRSYITLWLIEGNTTRLIRLPWMQLAENALEGERDKMGKGIPVTFGKDVEKAGQGWKYKVQSYGRPIVGTLPSK